MQSKIQEKAANAPGMGLLKGGVRGGEEGGWNESCLLVNLYVCRPA
jgi:hypothetical protein